MKTSTFEMRSTDSRSPEVMAGGGGGALVEEEEEGELSRWDVTLEGGRRGGFLAAR